MLELLKEKGSKDEKSIIKEYIRLKAVAYENNILIPIDNYKKYSFEEKILYHNEQIKNLLINTASSDNCFVNLLDNMLVALVLSKERYYVSKKNIDRHYNRRIEII